MSLVEQMMRGCVYMSKRWSGDCGEMSNVDEDKTDELLQQGAQRLWKLENALKRIRDCQWPGPLPLVPSRADWMQQIAREALE